MVEKFLLYDAKKTPKTYLNAATDGKTYGLKHVTAFISDYTPTVDCKKQKKTDPHTLTHSPCALCTKLVKARGTVFLHMFKQSGRSLGRRRRAYRAGKQEVQ